MKKLLALLIVLTFALNGCTPRKDTTIPISNVDFSVKAGTSIVTITNNNDFVVKVKGDTSSLEWKWLTPELMDTLQPHQTTKKALTEEYTYYVFRVYDVNDKMLGSSKLPDTGLK